MRTIVHLAKHDPDLLVAGLFGAGVAVSAYVAYAALGFGLSKLFS